MAYDFGDLAEPAPKDSKYDFGDLAEPVKTAPKEKPLAQRIGESAKTTLRDLPYAGYGILEAGLQAGIGAGASLLADAVGVGAKFSPFGGGEEEGQAAQKNIKEQLTFQPRTEYGKKAAEGLGIVTRPISYLSEKAGEFAQGLTGSKVVGETVKDAAPALIVPGAVKAVGAAEKGIASTGGRAPVGRAADVARASQAEGYVISPKDIPGAGPVQRNIEGITGKQRTEQTASIRNQPITNKLMKRDVGIPEDQEISPATLKPVLDRAAAPYKEIENIGTPFKPTFGMRRSLAEASDKLIQMSKRHPELVDAGEIEKVVSGLSKKEFDPADTVFLIKRLRQQGNANFAAARIKPSVEKQELARVQLTGATALEDMVEANLPKDSDLVQRFREGRKLYAKTMDLAKNTDAAGNVNPAPYLKKLRDEQANPASAGKLLTGDARKVAEFAAEFPKSAQHATKLGGEEGLTVFDMWFAGAELASGHAVGAAAALLRPTIRGSVALGKRLQRIPGPKPKQHTLTELQQARDNPTATAAGAYTLSQPDQRQ